MIGRVLLAAGVAAVLAGVLFTRPHATPGPAMRDFEAYYAAGSLWQHRVWPYDTRIWTAERNIAGVDASRYEVLPFVGPPALLPAFASLAYLPFDRAVLVWRALLLCAMAAIVICALSLAGVRLSPMTILAGATAAIGFGPLTSALALGQIALPAFAFAAIAAWLPAAGFLAWIQPNVALANVWQCVTRKGALALVGGLGVFATACAAVVGRARIAGYLSVLQEHGAAEKFSAIQMTPAAIAYGFGATESLAAVIGVALALAAIALWFALLPRLPDNASRFAATCALLPVAMPFFHEHDLLVLFIPAIVVTLRADARVWPIAAAGAMLCATDWLGLAQRPDGLVQTLLLVGGLGAALFALRRDARARMLAIPVCVLAAIAVAGVFAQAHPSPVWPDAMSALPANVRTMSVASAWHAEQAATGLLSRNGAWALLRLLSLLGCALLVSAVWLSSRSTVDSKNPLPVPA